MVEEAFVRADRASRLNVWITQLSREQISRYVQALEGHSPENLPLYGIPFVIKDNIDLAGVPTTAACREYSYVPQSSATVVQKLIGAGAIPLGKTNLDQFATGLVGTRSPYGVCRNSFNQTFISGGSSSGSTVAVAMGLASFGLGTDTAGSGRIPAAFNNVVGLKPSLGRVSTRGVVPANRTLDCVSICALTTSDAARVLEVAEGFDEEDPYSRPLEQAFLNGFRCGIPRPDQLQFFGDAEYARLFEAAVTRVRSIGGTLVKIDASPLLDAAKLLYGGAWVAERYAAIAPFMQTNAAGMNPVTREIIQGGASPSAADAFDGQYRLMALKRAAEKIWADVDTILMPTAPTIFEIEQVEADPIRLNSALGYYTNFVNLMDLAAVAVPAGFRKDGLPFGVTLIGRRSTDRALLKLAGRLHRASGEVLGAVGLAMPAPLEELPVLEPGFTAIAVCGAHMLGLPLNRQLVERGGYLLRRTTTAPRYRFYALAGGPPYRPGLVRVSSGGGAIDVEVWALRSADFASFVQGIPSPLGVGTVELADGESVPGFLCESYASEGATEITALGGWRAYLENRAAG